MSAEITVVFNLDLTGFISGSNNVSHKASQAIDELQNRIKIAGLIISEINWGSAQNIVLSLPKDECFLGDLLHFCNHGNLPYKTLWLNDSAQWHESSQP